MFTIECVKINESSIGADEGMMGGVSITIELQACEFENPFVYRNGAEA
jgi:hypothetical protein